MTQKVRVLAPEDETADLPLIEGRGRAVQVVGPNTGAEYRSLYLLQLQGGDRTVAMRHPSEAVYFVREGAPEVEDLDRGTTQSLEPGAMVHIGADVTYRFATGSTSDLIGGPCPPDPALYDAAGLPPAVPGAPGDGEVRLFHIDRPSVRIPLISRDARLIVWPGVDAETANMNYVRLEPGEANQPHVHTDSEDTVFILEGRGTVADLTNDRVLDFTAGQAVHVPPGVRHALRADQGVEIRSIGGPCPADPMIVNAARAAIESEATR